MEQIIEIEYQEAVQGLTADILANGEAWYAYVLQLPLTQKVVYSTVLFHSQIENGGFHQYFFNSYGQFSIITVESLSLIGAHRRQQLLIEAIELVNIDNLDSNSFRRLCFSKKIERINNFDAVLFEKLNQLDLVYYQMESESIPDLLETFVLNRT
jgi:hypothetical protein